MYQIDRRSVQIHGVEIKKAESLRIPPFKPALTQRLAFELLRPILAPRQDGCSRRSLRFQECSGADPGERAKPDDRADGTSARSRCRGPQVGMT